MTGRCHCGNLEVDLATKLAPAALDLRACQCSFCRRHGARTVTDPNAEVRIVAHDPSRLTRYRFGPKTADFLLCAHCGTYVAAVIEVDGALYATVNANTFDEPLEQAAAPVDYGSESAEARVARRRARWTPATLLLGAAPPQRRG